MSPPRGRVLGGDGGRGHPHRVIRTCVRMTSPYTPSPATRQPWIHRRGEADMSSVSEPPSVAAFRTALADAGGSGRIRVLPDSVHTAALAAEALGCQVGAIANSLLFDCGGSPVLILT